LDFLPPLYLIEVLLFLLFSFPPPRVHSCNWRFGVSMYWERFWSWFLPSPLFLSFFPFPVDYFLWPSKAVGSGGLTFYVDMVSCHPRRMDSSMQFFCRFSFWRSRYTLHLKVEGNDTHTGITAMDLLCAVRSCSEPHTVVPRVFS